MEHTVKRYLERISREKLAVFLDQYARGALKEDFSYIIPCVWAELKRREEREQDGTPIMLYSEYNK